MNFLYNIYLFMLNLLNYWLPWLIFFNDIWFLQLIIFYVLCLILITKNNYYLLLYIFFEIIFFGLYIGLVQGELFTGFLWVLEFTIIFIMLIFLFYLNVDGKNFQIYINYIYIYLFIFFIVYFNFTFLNINSFFLFNNIYLWDDYYESFVNKTMNDFLVLTISYYNFNNFELLIFGLLLLVGSIICVVLNKTEKTFKNLFSYFSYKNINSILNSFNFVFLRKQNFVNQALYKPSIRIFKKKKF